MSFFESFKNSESVDVKGKQEAGKSFANPDKLKLPDWLKGFTHVEQELTNASKLDSLTDKQVNRIDQLKQVKVPRQDRFEGDRGNSLALPDTSMVKGRAAKEWLDAHGFKGVEYRNGFPDFSKISFESVTISKMTADRPENFKQAYKAAAVKWNAEGRDGRSDWTVKEVKAWADENNLTIHEKEDLKTCEFVPEDVHAHFNHLGGCGIAAIAGIFSERQIEAGLANRGDFNDQFDA